MRVVGIPVRNFKLLPSVLLNLPVIIRQIPEVWKLAELLHTCMQKHNHSVSFSKWHSLWLNKREYNREEPPHPAQKIRRASITDAVNEWRLLLFSLMTSKWSPKHHQSVCFEYSNYYITVTMVIYLLSDSHWGCIYGGEWVEDVRVHAVSVCFDG